MQFVNYLYSYLEDSLTVRSVALEEISFDHIRTFAQVYLFGKLLMYQKIERHATNVLMLIIQNHVSTVVMIVYFRDKMPFSISLTKFYKIS